MRKAGQEGECRRANKDKEATLHARAYVGNAARIMTEKHTTTNIYNYVYRGCLSFRIHANVEWDFKHTEGRRHTNDCDQNNVSDTTKRNEKCLCSYMVLKS